jgi:hypothetical protein
MSIQRDGNFFYNRAAFEDQRPQHLPNQKSKVIYPQQPIDDKLVVEIGEKFSPVHAPGAHYCARQRGDCFDRCRRVERLALDRY